METLTYVTPQPVAGVPSALTFQLTMHRMQREPTWAIHAEVKDDHGRLYDCRVTDPAVAQALITSLNKANLTVKSMDRRVLEWLQANVNPATGVTYLPAGGSYVGSPD